MRTRVWAKAVDLERWANLSVASDAAGDGDCSLDPQLFARGVPAIAWSNHGQSVSSTCNFHTANAAISVAPRTPRLNWQFNPVLFLWSGNKIGGIPSKRVGGWLTGLHRYDQWHVQLDFLILDHSYCESVSRAKGAFPHSEHPVLLWRWWSITRHRHQRRRRVFTAHLVILTIQFPCVCTKQPSGIEYQNLHNIHLCIQLTIVKSP